jgi:hypothetical protein
MIPTAADVKLTAHSGRMMSVLDVRFPATMVACHSIEGMSHNAPEFGKE